MLRKWEFWIVTLVALVGAVIAGINMMLFQANRTTQTEIAGRQQYVAQSVQLEGLYREMVKALADLAVKNQDADVHTLLADQGITISVTSNAPATAPPAEIPKKAGR